MEPKVQAGIAVVSLAALIGVGAVIMNQKVPTSTCQMTVAGVGLIATSLKQGRTASGIAIGTSSGILATPACEAFLKSLDESPSKEMPVKVETPSGLVEDKIDRFDLTKPPPVTTSTAGNSRLLDCVMAYDTTLLIEWCLDGTISPR